MFAILKAGYLTVDWLVKISAVKLVCNLFKERLVSNEYSPSNQVLLVLGCFPKRFSERQLNKVLKLLVDIPPDGVGKNGFLEYRERSFQ